MNNAVILKLAKQRLNIIESNIINDEYLTNRIEAVITNLQTTRGITLVDDVEDQVLIADVVVWQYQNRDAGGAWPEWLRLQLKERWVSQKGREG